MKTKAKIYRQGDVLIQRIDRLPKESQLAKQAPIDGRIILARGEATGHHHSIVADAADWWKADDGDQFVVVHTSTSAIHQEHDPIALEPGYYRIRRQREYSPEAIRNVAD